MRTWISALAAACLALGVGRAESQPGARERPRDNGLKVGDAAPDFKLAKLRLGKDAPAADAQPAPEKDPPSPEGKKEEPKADDKKDEKKEDKKGPETVALSSFKGKKPVLLVFGSYT